MRVHRRIAWTSLICISITVAAGCGDRSDTSSLPPPPQTKAEPAGPTTKELLEAPRQTTSLTVMPFTVKIPPSWKVESMSDRTTVVLHGPAPTTNVDIVLMTSRPRVSTDNLQRIVDAAKRSMDQNPQQFKKVDFRALGSVKILERRRVSAASSEPIADPSIGSFKGPLPVAYSWTVDLYVPDSGTYRNYTLAFLGLTVDEFAANQAFLHSIIDSLAFDESAAKEP